MPTKRSAKQKPKSGRHTKAAGRSGTASGPIRLQRVLASAGYGSRRQCEELIEAGRVEVDGEIVTRLGTTADPEAAKVRVDGDLLKPRKLVYYAVNKPIGVVTTNRDPHGRPRVIDLVPPVERVFPVGRLDLNSEGLILLTNDGELAQRLTHPKFGVRKVYRVTVAGKVEPETLRQMRHGIYLAEGHVRVEGAKLLKSRSRSTEMEIVLREGKNREIRRILARLGHKVQHLRRIAVGPLRLGDLPAGAHRSVRRNEIDKLWAVTEEESAGAAGDERGQEGQRRGTKKRVTKKRGPSKPTGSKGAGSKGAPTKRTSVKRAPTKRASAKVGPKSTRQAKPKGRKASSAGDAFSGGISSDTTIGSVIGGDPAEREATATTRGGRKRSVRSKSAGKTSTSTRGAKRRTSSTRGSGGKTSTATRGAKRKTSTRGSAGKTSTSSRGAKRKSATSTRGAARTSGAPKRGSVGRTAKPKNARGKQSGPGKRVRRKRS
ncbi:MAG: pseudouridine synthase [Rubripirellula sp.]|nr:pseudouridine synthase [Rubripirellula sp.]